MLDISSAGEHLNAREYSRVNWETLVYPALNAADCAVVDVASIFERSYASRSVFMYWIREMHVMF